MLIGRRPTTRSRLSRATSKKQATQGATDHDKEQQASLHVATAEPLIQLPTLTEANGSMEAFVAMRMRQKEADTVKSPANTTPTINQSAENVVEEDVLPDVEAEDEEAGIFSPLLTKFI